MADKKIKVLILDDEKDICKFVKLLFRRKGFLVYSALTKGAAVRIAKKVKPDIALLDIYLKNGITGLDTLRQMRKVAPLCKCLMVTWDKAEAMVKKAKELGAVSYLVKPLTIEQLLKVVDRAVRQIIKDIRKRGR